MMLYSNDLTVLYIHEFKKLKYFSLLNTAVLQCIWAQVVLDAGISVALDTCYVFYLFFPPY